MRTARQIKYNRLLTKIILAKEMVAHYNSRPYSWSVYCELYAWECKLKHQQAMLGHFESTLK